MEDAGMSGGGDTADYDRLIAGMNADRVRGRAHKSVFREGVVDGSNSEPHIQKGFDAGYTASVSLAASWSFVQMILRGWLVAQLSSPFAPFPSSSSSSTSTSTSTSQSQLIAEVQSLVKELDRAGQELFRQLRDTTITELVDEEGKGKGDGGGGDEIREVVVNNNNTSSSSSHSEQILEGNGFSQEASASSTSVSGNGSNSGSGSEGSSILDESKLNVALSALLRLFRKAHDTLQKHDKEIPSNRATTGLNILNNIQESPSASANVTTREVSGTTVGIKGIHDPWGTVLVEISKAISSIERVQKG